MVVTREQIAQFRAHLTTGSPAEAAFFAPQLLELVEALNATAERLSQQLAIARERLTEHEAALGRQPCQACGHSAALATIAAVREALGDAGGR